MQFIHTTFRMTLQRIRQTKMTSLFFIFGMTLSMLMVSVGISFVSELIAAQRAKEKAMPPNGEQFGLYRPGEEMLEFETTLQLFSGLGPGSGVIVNHLMLHLDQSEVNTFCSVSAELFADDDRWHYPVIEGRYFTVNEIRERKKVVLTGKSLKKYEREQDGKKYLDIEGETYEVIGTVGMENQISLWDNRIFMPFTSLPEQTKQIFNSSSEMNFILYHSEAAVEEELQNIEENGSELYPGCQVESYGFIQVEDVMKDIANSQEQIFSIAILGYVVTLIYAVNIVVFWIEKRRYEIGIRKAFGYTGPAIAQMIYGEMLGLTMIACVVAIVIQEIISLAAGRISGYTCKVYFSNIAIGTLIVFLTAAIISIWPIHRALKIQPAAALKEGGDDA